MIVMKFGGTSVQDAPALENVCRIVARHKGLHPVVVVSACAGVTNALVRIANSAAASHETTSEVNALRSRHALIAAELLGNKKGEVLESLEKDFNELESLIKSIAVLQHLPPRTLDQVAAYGELWSSLLLAAALQQRGIRCERKDARTVLATDSEFTHAAPLFDLVAQNAHREFAPPLELGAVVVTQGFIGSTREGVTTTLGRGGSDYSAAIFGAALDAGEIQIWTDVDGMLSADPAIIPQARLIREMSFNEAAELAYFGAKVLHPSTILPAIRKNIPVKILNSRRPEAEGTLITGKGRSETSAVIKSIAYKKDITVITVQSTRMLMSHGFLARVFEVFARFSKSVDVVATSEVGVSMTVDDASSLDRILSTLREFADVELQSGRAVVCVVGEGMKQTKGIAGRAFMALGNADVNVELISHGGSEINLTFVIRDEEIVSAVKALHSEFF